MNETTFQFPNAIQMSLMSKLTSEEFPGSEEIKQQLLTCQVRVIDSDGSLEVKPANSTGKALVSFRVPAELCSNDVDGVAVHVLLHVVDGLVSEIEIYKDAPTPICELPNEWSVITY